MLIIPHKKPHFYCTYVILLNEIDSTHTGTTRIPRSLHKSSKVCLSPIYFNKTLFCPSLFAFGVCNDDKGYGHECLQSSMKDKILIWIFLLLSFSPDICKSLPTFSQNNFVKFKWLLQSMDSSEYGWDVSVLQVIFFSSNKKFKLFFFFSLLPTNLHVFRFFSIYSN